MKVPTHPRRRGWPKVQPKLDPQYFGQVFTPDAVIDFMCALMAPGRLGAVLEPSCGDGAFLRRLAKHIPGRAIVGVELDPRVCPSGAINEDFLVYASARKRTHKAFDTIIGNPPYVKFQDILPGIKARLDSRLLDRRGNLYLHFIERCVRLLAPGGELIFITPRDFIKLTGAVRLNRWLCEEGSFTHVVELGDRPVFKGATPNCMIWRFEKGRHDRAVKFADLSKRGGLDALVALSASGTRGALGALHAIQWEDRECVLEDGHLSFESARSEHEDSGLIRLSEIAVVKVGAISGDDGIFTSVPGNREFVCSQTRTTGALRTFLWSEDDASPPAVLQPFKDRLISRGVRKFNEDNWWRWGRRHYQSRAPRIYVNAKTRQEDPFFIHDCPDYDGSVLAVFPKETLSRAQMEGLRDALNQVDWEGQGFVCDGRFLFSQRSLMNAKLPTSIFD